MSFWHTENKICLYPRNSRIFSSEQAFVKYIIETLYVLFYAKVYSTEATQCKELLNEVCDMNVRGGRKKCRL